MMEKAELTKREKVILDYIVRYRQEKHYSPSMRQIAKGIGLNSVATIHGHIHKLEKKGWIMPYDGTARSIVPTADGF